MFSVKQAFKNRTVGFYIGLAAAVVALIGDILYIAIDGADRTFTSAGFALVLVGAIAELLVVFTEFRFAPLIPAAFYIGGFALALNVALPSLSDVWNGVTFIGGNATLGVIFSATFLICATAQTASCFMNQRRAAEKETESAAV